MKKKLSVKFCVVEVPLVLQKEAVIRKREVEVGEEEKEARIAQMKDWQRYTHHIVASAPTSKP